MAVSPFARIKGRDEQIVEKAGNVIAEHMAARGAAILAANGGAIDPEAKTHVEPELTPADMQRLAYLAKLVQIAGPARPDVIQVIKDAYPDLAAMLNELPDEPSATVEGEA